MRGKLENYVFEVKIFNLLFICYFASKTSDALLLCSSLCQSIHFPPGWIPAGLMLRVLLGTIAASKLEKWFSRMESGDKGMISETGGS